MIEEIKRAMEIPEVKAEVMKLIEPEITEVVNKMVAGLPSNDNEITNSNNGVHNQFQQPPTPPQQPINFDTGQPMGSAPANPNSQQLQLEQLGTLMQVIQPIIPYLAQALGFAPKPSENSQEEVFEKMKSNYMFFKELEGQNDSSTETLQLVSSITKALLGKNDSPAEVMGTTVDTMLASNNRGNNDSK